MGSSQFVEPDIVINGVLLSTAQAMTLRVALGSFVITLENGLGEDEIGKALTNGYRNAANQIHEIMLERRHP